MAQYLKIFKTEAEYENVVGTENEPKLSYIVEAIDVIAKDDTDYTAEYFTFVALEDGTFSFSGSVSGESANTVSYSLDSGVTWTVLENNTNTPTVTSGKKIMWKANATPFNYAGVGNFKSSNKFDAEGNVMSLLYGDDFEDKVNISSRTYTFYKLFDSNANLVSAKKMKIPATTLSNYCYVNMFNRCTSLVSAPSILPANTLTTACYNGMFARCPLLVDAPKLPATALANSCYEFMFGYCTSLKKTPELPARNLAGYCYREMFAGCTNLLSAPELSSTSLNFDCYNSMFSGCTSLVSIPEELPAVTVSLNSYDRMFADCKNITKAPRMAPTLILEKGCKGMFSGCTRLSDITELSLPATKAALSSFEAMFKNCTSLTTAPELPATTLSAMCYSEMFAGCTSLTTAPALPARKTMNTCYSNMFNGCTSLTTAPNLPATTLTYMCYNNMFYGCSNLTTPPQMSANVLAESCYQGMFINCTKLTTAPILEASSLVKNCYKEMFRGCSRLNYIKAMFTTTPSTTYNSNWVSGVASSGTFVKSTYASWSVSGVNGIPSGWRVETAMP